MNEQKRFILMVPRNKKRGIVVPRDFYDYFFDLINLNNFPVSVSAVQSSSGEAFGIFSDDNRKWRVTKSIYAFVVEVERESKGTKEVNEDNG